MEYQNLQKLFTNDFNYDKKHKLNTTSKQLPLEIVSNINKGVTLEQLENITSKGFDVYKYATQITIHGICNELTNNNVCRYASLILNKNKSLGVKWIAVDAEKKSDICKKLSYFEWHTTHTSQKFYPSLIERFSNLQDAQKRCNEYKIIADRIDNDLFFGSYNIYIGEAFGMYFAIFDLFINGIKQENVIPLLEQITGMPNKEMNDKIDAIEKEKAEKHKQWEKEYQEKKRHEDEIREKVLADAIKRLSDEGYKKVLSNTLQVGSHFIEIRDTRFEIYLIDYEVTERTCKCLSKKNILTDRKCYELDNSIRHKNSPLEVWAK